MDSQNFLNILDAMRETGVYVIREDNHKILYMNQRVRSVTPAARLGAACHELWPESCGSCPLLTIGDKQENRSVCYNSPFGKTVDLIASRTMWDGEIPAFVISLTPHTEEGGIHRQEVIRALGERDFGTYVINLDDGSAAPVRVEGQMQPITGGRAVDWEMELLPAIRGQVRREYREELEQRFSLDSLRRARDAGEDRIELNHPGALRDITGEKSREAANRERDLEQMDIIRSLSGMFFATYYINLKEDTLRGITQLDEVAEPLGERAGFNESIRAYAETFIHPDDRAEYLAVMSAENLRERLGPDRPLLAIEYRKLPADAREAGPDQCGWVRSTVALVRSDSAGHPLTALYAAQDVTESKQKEAREHRALREACRAANHASAAKSEFLSRMSRDIRTPMNGIIGMTNMAIANVENRDRVLECLKKISVSSRRLLNLVNEMLDMSQIESGKIDLTEEAFSVPEMVRELAVITRSSVREKGHELRILPLRVEHTEVVGDRNHLQQVFVNILGNSVKYTPPGGLLEIEVREKESGEHGLGCYDFVFRDNGIGMDEAFVARIFEPYSRAEDSRISSIEGTGLGMTIAQNIVRMMGGSITVKSRLGEGSQFTVTLFLRQQEEITADRDGGPGDDAPASLRGCRFLLVEDNAINREIARAILEDAGVEIDCVENGRQAVERFAAAAPGFYDLILMDIQMPVMNGHEAARAIRRLTCPDGGAIPIIAMSANAFAEDISASREAGMNDHITKPFDISRMLSCLRTWLKPR